MKIFLTGLLGWLIFSNAAVYPHYLTYFNEIAGGPKDGYKWLLDSNYDWGQDLTGLKRYMDKNGIGEISLSYFGRGYADYYGIRYEVLPSSMLSTLPWYIDEEGPPPMPKEWTAVSVTHLMGFYLPPKYRYFYEGLRKLEPVARIGNTIYVYRLASKRG